MCKRRGPILGSILIAALPSVARPQPIGGGLQLNSYTTDHQRFADVSSAGNGSFVVVWTSEGQDGDARGIFAQRFDSMGNAAGGEFQVNTYTTQTQGDGPAGRGPRVSSAGDGSFVVVWSSYSQDGDNFGLFGQRFAAQALPRVPSFE